MRICKINSKFYTNRNIYELFNLQDISYYYGAENKLLHNVCAKYNRNL